MIRTFFFISLLLKSTVFSAPYTAVLMEPLSGLILAGFAPQKRVYPASLTKMMTLFQIFEALELGRIHMDTLFCASSYASRQPPSKWGLRPYQRMSVRDSILALSVRSANDVAIMVAENLEGSLKKFVKRMNQTAKKLHMHHTHFCNPSGWHHPFHRSTAQDMALLLRALWLRFPRYASFLGVPFFKSKGLVYRNTNKLLSKVKGMKMGKTGYTSPAGWNLATLTMRSGRPLIVVVMGMKTASERDSHMVNLIHGFYTKTALPSLKR